jgi:hypothetical protein
MLKDYRDSEELKQIKRIVEALEDEDNGWKEWIKIENNAGAPRFKRIIVDWLAAPVNKWEKNMPDNASAQGIAKRFFEHEDVATLDKLGVWIIEGDFPGSAELRNKVEEANEVAKKLRLSYRFREAKS